MKKLIASIFDKTCPVCSGKGIVKNKEPYRDMVKCKYCKGRGITLRPVVSKLISLGFSWYYIIVVISLALDYTEITKGSAMLICANMSVAFFVIFLQSMFETGRTKK